MQLGFEERTNPSIEFGGENRIGKAHRGGLPHLALADKVSEFTQSFATHQHHLLPKVRIYSVPNCKVLYPVTIANFQSRISPHHSLQNVVDLRCILETIRLPIRSSANLARRLTISPRDTSYTNTEQTPSRNRRRGPSTIHAHLRRNARTTPNPLPSPRSSTSRIPSAHSRARRLLSNPIPRNNVLPRRLRQRILLQIARRPIRQRLPLRHLPRMQRPMVTILVLHAGAHEAGGGEEGAD